ncbi:hypothetical protein [Falsibacillus albus]|uniref:Uncharacterized protein n=1 Tax=Falsibacillus albus TaxID=2478915 RepID=A0A3L7K2G6_9BACI|nr:hypothetical protein [Falsibacillus albus]RLQ97203.1 hypothetical protein D9X91_03365 [Falsibacillus albus]
MAAENMQGQNQQKHPFDIMVFGQRENNEIQEMKQESNMDAVLNGIDIDEMMGHIDSLVDSFSYFKPYFKKMTPLIDIFKQSVK